EQAGNANAIFENGLLQFELNDGIKNILKKLLLDNYKKFVQSPMNEKKRISEEIDRLNARLSVARNKLLSETIDDEEYLEMKKGVQGENRTSRRAAEQGRIECQENQYRKALDRGFKLYRKYSQNVQR